MIMNNKCSYRGEDTETDPSDCVLWFTGKGAGEKGFEEKKGLWFFCKWISNLIGNVGRIIKIISKTRGTHRRSTSHQRNGRMFKYNLLFHPFNLCPLSETKYSIIFSRAHIFFCTLIHTLLLLNIHMSHKTSILFRSNFTAQDTGDYDNEKLPPQYKHTFLCTNGRDLVWGLGGLPFISATHRRHSFIHPQNGESQVHK